MNSGNKKNAFSLIECMVSLLLIAITLWITIPNFQGKEKIISAKGCEALIEVVNSQIMLYEIDEDRTPTSVQELISKGYLKDGQAKCPDGKSVVIVNGQAASR
ncbi:competence type IV pilus major pilin ComGC [uncultured Allobaculum sp.]|uniref:competence type IV pilus major pilin ComGC n=1 Tax=uncultured Allobaculum sp. TaxID=1187017 RepID=UPI002582A1CB|nr:competence type IV pilus major pilin ComGC [uncultured Allobaculum sp.]